MNDPNLVWVFFLDIVTSRFLDADALTYRTMCKTDEAFEVLKYAQIKMISKLNGGMHRLDFFKFECA